VGWLAVSLIGYALLGDVPGDAASKEAIGQHPDILVADFERQDYGNWKVEGDAFGTGPAAGTLPNQSRVYNYQGNKYASSYHGGDGTTGTLTSPPFTIQRRKLSFLIGGGDHKDETCINLVIDGRIVRTETGQNNEKLEPFCWDVREFAGKQATLQIVDNHKGGWGHIAVDQIVQTDQEMLAMISMEYTCPSVNNRFLHLPISSGARSVWVNISVDGVWQRELSIALAGDKPDYYVSLEVGQWRGKQLTLAAEKVHSDSQWRKLITLSDDMWEDVTVYTEKYRPQFHFTVRQGGIGDPNGLVYFGGEYHLFGQHRAFQGENSGGMESTVWAHAVGSDLFHWLEYPIAVLPDKLGVPFSGSGLVDWKNTTGLVKNPVKDKNGRLKNPAMVVFYTSEPTRTRNAGDTSQSMAYSLASGRTWIAFSGNPVVPNIVRENRDPKVFWYEDRKNLGNPNSGRWIMALYLSGPDYALLASKDLIHWERTGGVSNIGCVECPDMFELPVEGNRENTRWVFWGGNGNHVIGTFDGRIFTRESGPFSTQVGNEYAAQTFSEMPEKDGRRIQLATLYGDVFPGMPFKNQLTIPRVLTLRTTPQGIRLFVEPAREIEQLRTGATLQIHGLLAGVDAPLKADRNPGELVDAEAVFEVRRDALTREGANVFGLNISGQVILCDLDQKQIKVLDLVAPLNLVAGKIKLRLILDRMSIEVFVNDGAFRFTKPFVPKDGVKPALQAFGKQGLAAVHLRASPLQSVWKKKARP
jgi:fructan beta-fructosidase